MIRRLIAIALLLAGAGCWATEEQLLRRASFDLQCPASKLQTYELDSRTRAVAGCGDKAVYIESCPGANHTDCTWVLNSPR
jgi:hypothetical protein